MNLAFKTRNITAYTNSLAQYLPNDELFAGKNKLDSNVRALLKGLAFTLFDTNGYLKEFSDDYTPDVTQNFLAEWESAVGIPDECFNAENVDLSTRRLQIIAKLSYMACQNNQDFVDLAALFGHVVTVTPGIEDTSGTTAGLTDTKKRFTIVINTLFSDANAFPLTFPILFGSSAASFLACIYTKIVPSNCQILFNNQG